MKKHSTFLIRTFILFFVNGSLIACSGDKSPLIANTANDKPGTVKTENQSEVGYYKSLNLSESEYQKIKNNFNLPKTCNTEKKSLFYSPNDQFIVRENYSFNDDVQSLSKVSRTLLTITL